MEPNQTQNTNQINQTIVTPEKVDQLQPVIYDNTPELSKVDFSSENTIAIEKSVYNKQSRKKAWKFSLSIFIIIGIISSIVIIMGMRSSSYSYVGGLSSITGILGIIFALTAGITSAYTTAHPTQLYFNDGEKQSKTTTTIWLIIGIIGLFFGVIPGLIILIPVIFTMNIPGSKFYNNDPSQNINNRKLTLQSTNLLMLAAGLILGLIPGIIMALVISYPLSARACELSGAKCC